ATSSATARADAGTKAATSRGRGAADHGGTQASTAGKVAGNARPASRTSTGTSSDAWARSVVISLGSQGRSTGSGSRANALDIISTTTGARDGAGSSAWTNPLR